MKNDDQKFIQVHAMESQLVDLDEHTTAVKLRDHLSSQLPSELETLELDLRGCWVDYSHSSTYLDVALEALEASKGNKKLVIKTSIDFGSRGPMACLFFQMSKLLDCKSTIGTCELEDKLNSFCTKTGLKIAIYAYEFSVLTGDAPPINRYEFPFEA